MSPKADRAKCRDCDKPFTKKRVDQAFCSDACRKRFWFMGGVSVKKIRYLIEQEVKQVESRLSKRFLDMLRKRGQEIPAELQQMADA